MSLWRRIQRTALLIRTTNRPIGTENATISGLRTEHSSAMCAFVEIDTCIDGHRLFLSKSTVGTSYSGQKTQFDFFTNAMQRTIDASERTRKLIFISENDWAQS